MKKLHPISSAAIIAALLLVLMPLMALARGGGGGSGGGGGGGGSGGGGSFLPWPYNLIEIAIYIGFVLYGIYVAKKKREQYLAKVALTHAQREIAEQSDAAWDDQHLQAHIKSTFLVFQDAWCKFDMKTLESILTPDFYKHIYLELTVLQNLHRKNAMSNVMLVEAHITDISDDIDNSKDFFHVDITGSARDELIDSQTNKVLFTELGRFTETWTFFRDGNTWKLGKIAQSTENAQKLIPRIQEFAQVNNFYYNPDFGWLMMPNKGVLFSKTNFGLTDTNNHVVGYYKEKIVEFYTMQFYTKDRKSSDDYLVGQAILPVTYNNILIKRDALLNIFKKPDGLRKHELESVDFNREFDIYSHPSDNISTFQLLHPAFMEYIMKLPFRITIEVVGNVLYFYTKETSKADYPKLLEILSRAFDELKRP